MISVKKIATVTLILGHSALFAGTMGPVCVPGNVTVPCPTMGWDIGIQALYLQPLYSNSNLSVVNVGSVNGTLTYDDLDNDFEWGFRLEGSYHFGPGNDINVNWIRWHDDLSVRSHAGHLSTSIDPTAPLINLGSVISSGTDFDAVNFEFAQHVDFGEFKDIRFHAGAQYTRIHTQFRGDEIISGTTIFATLSGFPPATGDLKFNGGGPRLGMDMTYNWGAGFSIYGKGAIAAIVGENEYRNNSVFSDIPGALSRPVYSSFVSLVPEIDAKLGAAYTFGTPQGNFTLDVGYMVVNYFNALHFSNLDLNTAHETRLSSDFGLHGAYAGLKWISAV
ncbi:Lpg1974 family pore-forming outer membrane protein [Legionella gresilensis]|uniref:Lpg1974 family pore-forming outer membrane protein n=1 Tax=Legionella gresilensis TaxID=91823 RepID=UPI001041015D|nr:Lpg1974 family pore-forming outer membrane protein [Legionella gresilensis]